MSGFNPVNEVAKKQYEEILLHARHRDPKTARAVWNSINLFENFTGKADFKTFNAEQAKSFKVWLEKQRNQKGELLSLPSIRSTLNNVREFFVWLITHPQYVKKIDGRAVQYLRLSNNANRAARASRDKKPPTLQELEIVLNIMPHNNDVEKRDRAVFAFTIITCMRDDALVSLKIQDVDVPNKTVWQNPRHVRTKNRKGIVTRFVGQPLPLAETIALEWLNYVINTLGFKPSDPVFSKTQIGVNSEKMAFEAQGLSREHWADAQPVREIFKTAFRAAGLPYYNPHLIRKTIAKWGLKNLTQYEYKAFSQNIGHEDVMVTYNSYATLTEDEQIDALANAGHINVDLQNIPTEVILAEMARRASK